MQPFCRAIQFSHAEQFSAHDLLGLVHPVLYGFPSARLGGYRGARDELIFAPLGRCLTARGATIRTGVKIREIEYDGANGRVAGFVGEDGLRVQADAYVAAMPAWAFAPLVPGPLRELPFFADIAALPVAPAIAVQLWFDRVVTDSDGDRLLPHTNVVVYQDQSPRPTQATPIANLFLAGDWTQQEFFGSQEGAVRGGKARAREIRARLQS